MRRSRDTRSLNNIKTKNFKNGYKTAKKAFRKLISELERLLYLALDEKQSINALCTVLWSGVEGCPWSLQAMMK